MSEDRREGAVEEEGAVPAESAEPQTPEAEVEPEAPKTYEESHKPFHVAMIESLEYHLAMGEQDFDERAPGIEQFLNSFETVAGVFIPEADRLRLCELMLDLAIRLNNVMDATPFIRVAQVKFLLGQLDKETLGDLLSVRGWEMIECTCEKNCGTVYVLPVGFGGIDGLKRFVGDRKREQLRQMIAERTGLDVRELGVDPMLDEQGQPLAPEGAFAAMILTPDGGMVTTDARGIARLMTANAEGPEKLQEVAQAMVAEGVATMATSEGAEAPAEVSEETSEQPTEEGAPAAVAEEQAEQ